MSKADAEGNAEHRNFIGIILALIVFVVGLTITILIPVLGWVVGPLLMLLSLGHGR